MPFVTAGDGARLHVRDWGEGRPVVLLHGWPLSGESWEYQALPLAEAGFRVVMPDRRGFGRSDQPWDGYDYDTFADDLAAVIGALELEEAVLVGFSMGGGEVARYMVRHGGQGVARAALVSAVTPLLIRTVDNEEGVDGSALEEMKRGLREDRPGFLEGFFRGFYGAGFLGIGGGASGAILAWSQMMALQASPRATLACVDAFGLTDFRPDMAAITVPTLVVHGSQDATVPVKATAYAAARMLPNVRLAEYPDAAHGLFATHAELLTRDLLQFLEA